MSAPGISGHCSITANPSLVTHSRHLLVWEPLEGIVVFHVSYFEIFSLWMKSTEVVMLSLPKFASSCNSDDVLVGPGFEPNRRRFRQNLAWNIFLRAKQPPAIRSI